MLSIIVPMYNVKPYADECIQSIISQSFKDFELILVDDGSTDGTGEIIDTYAGKDKRINVIHKENGGPTSARKSGAKVATGEYVVIVDGDDWIESDYLEKIANSIKYNNPDVILCGFTKEAKNKTVKSYYGLDIGTYARSSDEFSVYLKERLLLSSPTLWAKCFRTDAYLEMQMKIADYICMGEDGCISYPLVAKAEIINVIDNTGYHYRYNPSSLTKSKNKFIPFDYALWRIKHLKNNLPDCFEIDQQMAKYAGKSIFNAICTNFRCKPYRDVISEATTVLNDQDVSKYISINKINGSKKNVLAHFLVKHRMFWAIKLISEL